jgi:hypothetical protein
MYLIVEILQDFLAYSKIILNVQLLKYCINNNNVFYI